LDQYAAEIGVTLLVLITAAWIVSCRRKFKHDIEALRLEFRRLLDHTRTASTKRATAIGDNLLSVIKPIDVAVTNLNVRLGKLEEHADAVSSFMAGPQRQALEDEEQIYGRLTKVEQRLKALVEQLSLLNQTINEATIGDQQRDKSLESLNSRLIDAQRQADGLFSRVDLGEKARVDLGSLIGLFVKQLKRVNINSAEIALRVAGLEALRSKVSGLEERLGSDRDDCYSTGNLVENDNAFLSGATPNLDEMANLVGTNNGSEQSSTFEHSTSSEEAPDQSRVRVGNHYENGGTGHHPA
jgi:hypothetical protein